MKRIHLAITAILGLLAFTAITSIATAELTKILPEPTATEPITATIRLLGAGRLSQVGSRNVAECSGGLGNVTFTNANLGTGGIEYTGCQTTVSSIRVKCWGEADRTESGIVLSTGTVHYVLGLEMLSTGRTTLVSTFAILQAQFHFKCGISGVAEELILGRGCFASRDDSNERLTKDVIVLSHPWATGESRILEILPEGATREILCLGEAEEGTHGFTLAALEGEALISQWLKRGREIEVLLMN